MAKTKTKQKILLLCLSIALTIILLEVGLRLGGTIFNLALESGNKITNKDNEFRILCIGESTTAMGGRNSYPYQLEEILKQKRPDMKFEVINKGEVSTTSTIVLSHIEKYLETYRPQVVVSMLGINDFLVETNRLVIHGESFLSRLYVYKLWGLLKIHIKEKIKDLQSKSTIEISDEAFDSIEFEDQDDIDIKKILDELDASKRLLAKIEKMNSDLIQRLNKTPSGKERETLEKQISVQGERKAWVLVRMAVYYRRRKNYDLSEQYLKQVYLQDKNNQGFYIELGRVYKEQGKYDAAIPLFKRAIEINDKSVLAVVDLGRCYYGLGNKEEIYKISQFIYAKDFKQFSSYAEVSKWLKEFSYYDLGEKFLLRGQERDPTNPSYYDLLSNIYSLEGKEKEAQESQEKGKKVREKLEGFPLLTANNYNKIADIVFSHRINLVCMQYPLRDIKYLKDMFTNIHPIVFVENVKNFEAALENEEFAEYFSDKFGGNFGHCTRKGNRLIAENLAETILTKVLPQLQTGEPEK